MLASLKRFFSGVSGSHAAHQALTGATNPTRPRARRSISGASLVEVLMSISISSISIGGIFQGYLMASKRVEWQACSQAANSQVLQRVEQVRSARWEPQAYPAIDEVSEGNFPSKVVALDIPCRAGAEVYGTNTLTITTLSSTPPLRMITAQCVWNSGDRGCFTNSMVIYRGPDQ